MSIPVIVGADAGTVGAELAAELRRRCVASAGGKFVVGIPAGRTLVPVIEAVVDLLRREPVALDHVVLVLMDDYAIPLDGGMWTIPDESAHNSCRRFGEWMRQELNAAVAPLPGIPVKSLWSPDATYPGRYDERIREIGGIDLFYVAVGGSDGHVAFNPPASPLDSRTRIIRLADSTRTDSLSTFPGFASLDEVPRFGVSVGLATIADAGEIVMLAFGEHKAPAVETMLSHGDFAPELPATFAFRHANARLFLDAAAASRIVETTSPAASTP